MVARQTPPDSPSFARSLELWERASRVIPLGTQTLSKSPTQFVQGVHPIFLERGKGAHVWDVDGNEFVDFPMALGPVLLGHSEPLVDDAIRSQLERGIVQTLPQPIETEVAERIVLMCPGVEAVRFAKSGSDAVTAAVRAARAITGRDIVLVAGYHGWHDWFIGSTSRFNGVPESARALVKTFRFGDIDDLDQALGNHAGAVAAVIVEPAGAEEPPPGYLEAVVERTHSAGALSIFDEVITGFRVAPGGARQLYGAIPDLSCYGKALGNGMPISAVAGGWESMRIFEDVFFSGTHGGEALSLAAARAVLDAIADGQVLDQISAKGRYLQAGMGKVLADTGATELYTVSGHPSRSVVSFNGPDPLVLRTWTQQCMAEAGLLFNGSMFICARHDTQDLDRAIDAFRTAADAAASGADLAALLKGPLLEPVFRAP